MPRSLSACLALCLAVACVASLWATPSFAAANDAAVKRAISSAMDDYAKSKDSDKADGQLLDAIALCANQCKPTLLAQAWMYIGLVKGGGAKDWDSAREAFSVALGFDPKVELDPRFFSPTAQALFDGIKRQPAAEAGPAKVEASFEAGTQMGCFPLVQEVETFRPIPLSCSTRVQGVTGVTLRYREYGADSWTAIDLKQEGEDWRGEIPCNALSRPGTWGMYIEAKDERDNAVERIGARDRPLVFKVVEKSSLPPPALPGEPPPGRCVETAYCPEEMIGTPACDALKGGAEAKKDTTCKAASDCDFGMSCSDGICKAPGVCTENADCGDGICQAGLCAERERPAKLDWFGVHFGMDFSLLSGADDACRSGSDEFVCYDGGEAYDGTPYTGAGGTVPGGLYSGTMRVMLAYERFLLDNVSLGVRFGFAFSGAPDDFFPLHFEGRGTYYFSDVTRGVDMFAPYLAVGVGLAQVDTAAEVEMVDCLPDAVMECLAAPRVDTNLIREPGEQSGAAQRRTLDAYKTLGQVFGSISPGVLVQLSKELSGVVNVGVLLMTEDQRSTTIILNVQPSLGLALGF